MGVMRYPFFHCPILHGMSDHRGNLRIQMAALVNGLFERLIGILGKTLLHDGIVKNVAAKEVIHVSHTVSSSFLFHLWEYTAFLV